MVLHSQYALILMTVAVTVVSVVFVSAYLAEVFFLPTLQNIMRLMVSNE